MDWTSCRDDVLEKRREEPPVTVMAVMLESRTHISLQIIVSHVRFHAGQVPGHTQHDVIGKEELQTAEVAR